MIKCDGTTNLTNMGPLENLELLDVGEWKNLRVLCGGEEEEVINVLDSLAPTPTPLLFPSLRELLIGRCQKLKYLFGHRSKFYLPHLRVIKISECKEMVGITTKVTSPPPHWLPAFPSLEVIVVDSCDKMKKVVEFEWLPHFPNLKDIAVYYWENMEEIIGGPPPYMPIEEISLESLKVHSCDNMRKLFPHELLNHLRNLGRIEVRCCQGMVEIISGARQGQEGSTMTLVNNTPLSFRSSTSLPKLKLLELRCLPQLKSICGVPIYCNSMEVIVVSTCPELNRIPLQLQLRNIEDLPYIEVEDEEKWESLRWDDPNAQAILQPYLIFRGSTCVLRGHRSH
ncbi:hypothetical protein BT93_E0903 [Corymbia citriodora subsp. variegata]|nr:hypothetical protein BT93_E0903 [Corymbia citriodora subsp. variegata]